MHSDDVIEVFRNYLREHELPVTAQRLAIADIVLGSNDHLSAEDIMIGLGERGAHVGTATVYRTLELLLRTGLVVERDFGEGFKRYESAQGRPNHEHLVCSNCGRVVEFHEDHLEDLTTTLARREGFEKSSHRLVITGLCPDCRSVSEAPRVDG